MRSQNIKSARYAKVVAKSPPTHCRTLLEYLYMFGITNSVSTTSVHNIEKPHKIGTKQSAKTNLGTVNFFL